MSPCTAYTARQAIPNEECETCGWDRNAHYSPSQTVKHEAHEPEPLEPMDGPCHHVVPGTCDYCQEDTP